MSKKADTSLAGQVNTVWEHRSYLRSGISSLIAIAKTAIAKAEGKSV